MFNDILIPSKIGDSYLFSKRILSFEITQIAVHALLITCKGKDVVIQNKISVALKDFSTTSVVGAIKKIASTIGKYDEVVTNLSSSSVVLKELQLPFIGYEKIEMIIAYEVEGLLPFALDQAVIDFIVTEEDYAKSSSRVLVAAALKQDVDAQISLFEKAGISLRLMTVDIFALYTLFKHSLYVPLAVVEPKKSWSFLKRFKKKSIEQAQISSTNNSVEMFVDIGFDSLKILYVSSGVLKSVRSVPFGVYDIVQAISKKSEASYYDVVQHIIYKENLELYHDAIRAELLVIFEHIVRTMGYFENQLKDSYKKPQRIIFSGQGCTLPHFKESAQNFFNIPILEVNLPALFESLHIKDKNNYSIDSFSNLATALFLKYNDSCNLLKSFANQLDNSLFNKQIFTAIFLTIGCIGGIFWHSISELQRWNNAYTASRKELVKKLEQSMAIDVKSERSLKEIVAKAEETLKKERKLWFSFSKQTERSYLELLQDLSIHIDREDIGLDLKKLLMGPDSVTLTGSLKEWEKLEVFKQELSELELLDLVEEPRELTFTVLLKVKDKELS